MQLANLFAQRRAWKQGVVHTTLNPDGPGSVRIHLVPPRWRPFHPAPFVVLLNGYYALPLGYSWAILLGNFIEAVNPYEGAPMGEVEMRRAAADAVDHTRRVYYDVPRGELEKDLGQILGVLFDVAHGRTPQSPIGALSLRAYAPNMTAPHRMDLMVSPMTNPDRTWNCNLKCRHCYAAGQPGAGATACSTKQWAEIIDKCRAAGIPQLTFTGGEPTLRPDLAELISHARWFVTRLNTNGVLLAPELCRTLRAASLDSVQVTLYSFDPAIHDPLVGAGLPDVTGDWKKSVEGLRSALNAGLDVSVNTPLCRDNQDYVKTLAFLREQGVRYVSCSGLIETGKASGSAQLSVDEMDKLLCEAAAFCAECGMELSFTSPGRASVEVLRSLGLAVPMCGACLSNMAVRPDGTVVPCQSWLGEGMELGTLLHDPWAHIWNHPRCRSIRGMGEEESLCCPLRSQKDEVLKEVSNQ